METGRRNSIKAAFYTEAGTARGMGHLIRLHTIYKEFKKKKIESDFFLDSDINYSYICQDIQYFNWKSFSLDNNYDIIFIDSYEANFDIYTTIQKHAKIAIYIDDYGRLNYPQGVIINFAPDSNELFFNKKKQKHTYLLGIDFVPIRESFLHIKPNKQSKQLFLMLGGNDIKSLSKIILNTLQNIHIPKIVVVNDKNLINELQDINTKILYKPDNKELIQYMANSTIAISTASMTIYELAYFQIPTIIIAVSKNQSIGAVQLIKHQLASHFIDIQKNNWQNKLKKSIQQIDDTPLLTQKVDGNGVKRIYNKVLQLVEK